MTLSENWKQGMIVAALFLALVLQTVFAMRQKSPTVDEFAHHLANGYSYLITHDFRMNPGSPPLSRIWPALPLKIMGAKLPLNDASWEQGDTVAFAKKFFYQTNGDCLNRYVFWSRMMVVVLSVVFGLAVFAFARLLLGGAGGLITLFLYVFSPNILAHSELATADLMVAFFFFLTIAVFWSYLSQPGPGRLILLGVLVGATFLSKFSALILPPILFLIALAAGKIRELKMRRCIAAGAICLFTIWAGYLFEVKPLLQHTPDPAKKEAMYQKVGGEALASFARNVPVPLSTFSSALVSMMVTRYQGTNAYFMGEWSRTGWPQYYAVALAIKETIPLVALTLFGIGLAWKQNWSRITKAVLLAPIAAFFIFTLGDRAQAGVRYFLPVFPLFFILAACAAVWLWRRKSPLGKAVVAVLLSWHAVSALAVFPDHLAYFNETVGGPANGYKYLRDSNLDWGQDLKGVGRWAVREDCREVVVLTLGTEDPAYYGIRARSFKPDEFSHAEPTVYAIGAHQIDAVLWALKVRPTRVIGHSFFIFDFRKGVPAEAA